MNQYIEMYQQKLRSVEEALSYIKSNSIISHSYCANEPVTLLSNLHTLKIRSIIFMCYVD